jgi:Na+-transporting methylmalonyl-CoA/oxaloacetate decarboxylase gamma subunit
MAVVMSLSFNLDSLDSQAWIIAFVGYLIVFSALVLLFFVFSNLPKILNFRYSKLFRKKQFEETEELESPPIPGEVNAAIALALHMHFNEVHDKESNIVTIKRISRAYSPWSSKIYAVRNAFNRI